MTTVAEVLTMSREILQDAAADRYTDAQLLQHYNNGVVELRSVRPDIFTGAFTVAVPQTTLANISSDLLPVPDQFRAALAMYVAGMSELRDDEFAVTGRAAALISQLTRKAIGGA